MSSPVTQSVRSRGDTLFGVLCQSAGGFVLALAAALVAVLVYKAWPVLSDPGKYELLTSTKWYPDGDSLRGPSTEAFAEGGKAPSVPGPNDGSSLTKGLSGQAPSTADVVSTGAWRATITAARRVGPSARAGASPSA